MRRTYREGIIIYNVNGQYDLAIEIAKQKFFERYGYPADIIALPRGVNIETNLPVADTPAPPGCVIVGTSRQEYKQEQLL
ncbi:MAG: hypothetical protein D6800_10150 [Candidatus Zixiibacteriota bacterium]|nr:MAG: hypothetical protein D6800_10150 [candidate division Zixibacteria bacterium]